MTIYDSMFIFFSLAVLLSGLMVVLSRNPVISLIYLVLVFVFTAGLYVLLQAFFLALLQVLVYAGAIMVLFLFVIMLMDKHEPSQARTGNSIGLLGGAVLGAVFLGAVWLTIQRTVWPATAPDALFRGDLAPVVTAVFARYLLPVEITGLLLLVATIGVVLLTRREGST